MILLLTILLTLLIAVRAARQIQPVYAHCDSLDGPVVAAARQALVQRDVNHVLIWVRPQDEELVRQAFDTALQKLDAALLDEPARLKAETEFFEQVVKVHREREGETYEGLKPAGANEDERLGDQAVASGKVDDLLVRVHSEENKLVVKQLFQTLRDNAEYETSDLAAGRAYVRTYTAFIHAVGQAIRGEKLSGQSHNHSGR